MDIKVLGACCGNCKITRELIENVAQAKGIALEVETVKDMRDIAALRRDEHAGRRHRWQGRACRLRAWPRQGGAMVAGLARRSGQRKCLTVVGQTQGAVGREVECDEVGVLIVAEQIAVLRHDRVGFGA